MVFCIFEAFAILYASRRAVYIGLRRLVEGVVPCIIDMTAIRVGHIIDSIDDDIPSF